MQMVNRRLWKERESEGDGKEGKQHRRLQREPVPAQLLLLLIRVGLSCTRLDWAERGEKKRGHFVISALSLQAKKKKPQPLHKAFPKALLCHFWFCCGGEANMSARSAFYNIDQRGLFLHFSPPRCPI